MTAPVTEVAAASTAASSSAASARAVQVAISAAAMRDVTRLWPLLDKQRLNETFPGWLRAMILLTRTYHRQSSAAASVAYRSQRQAATLSPAPRSLVKLAPVPADEWLAKAFGFSGPGMLSRDTIRPQTALTTTLGTTARIVQDGGRTTTIDTVMADPVALGWYRVTDTKPCSFCALIASRGVVFKAQRQADFKAHNNCHCQAAPAFSADHQLPAVNLEADRVYRDRKKILIELGLNPKDYDALQGFRIAWEHHLASG